MVRLNAHVILVLGCEFLPTARNRILEVLEKGVLKGSLRIEDEDGSFDFGTATDKEPTVVMKIRSKDIWMRILTSADIGSTFLRRWFTITRC